MPGTSHSDWLLLTDVAFVIVFFVGSKVPAPDQLSIALAWDRVDIAKKHILVYGQQWKVLCSCVCIVYAC